MPKMTKSDGTDGSPQFGHNQPPTIRIVPIDSVRLDPDDTRSFTDRDIKRAANVEKAFGFPIPLLIGSDGIIRHAQLFWLAAKLNRRTEVPVVDARDLTPLQERALSMALGRILSSGKWKRDKQRDLFVQLIDEMPEFDLEATAFDMTEIDLILEPEVSDDSSGEMPIAEGPEVAQRGDIFRVGPHHIGCGDATDRDFYRALMGSSRAAAVFTDQPYGPKIAGFVSTKKRPEFIQGSGDMSPAELEAFSARYCEAMGEYVRPGAIVYLCMDWRGFAGLVAAARPTFGELINLAVYKKDRAGMGSFLRSQHELVLIFAKPGAKRRNNVQLGANGRHRTNVWEYPAAVSIGRNSEEGNQLDIHATPKPVKLVSDALLDSTARGDVVLDPFLGSGSTLVAADKIGRVCFGMDLDPRYVDASIRRLQNWTGLKAVHVRSGKTFDEIEAERAAPCS